MQNTLPQKHVFNILSNTRPHHPNFSILLGSGASVTSGVPDASQLVGQWRIQHQSMYACGKPLEQHLAEQPWYGKDHEYSVLFELLYDQPSQRREFIESQIESAKPSLGYMYLVNLIAHRVFTTTFTTNFDDLLNEACYAYSDLVRPIVCAHDSSIASVRLTSKRPKIIKLHGDFLFDDIKNTTRELESLEQNTKEKLRQFAREFGLIVVGYSGRDRSVMDVLSSILRSDDGFPHGVYWARRKGDPVSPAVENLQRFPRFRVFEIDGFDQFFAELNASLALPLQPQMADPYRALTDRFNELARRSTVFTEGKPHPVIAADIEKIASRLNLAAASLVTAADEADTKITREVASYVPLEFLAATEKRRGNVSQALFLLKQALAASPSARLFSDSIGLAATLQDSAELGSLLQELRMRQEVLRQEPMATFSMALKLIDHGFLKEASEVLELGKNAAIDAPAAQWSEEYYILNKLQIVLHDGKKLSEDQRQEALKIARGSNVVAAMGAHIVLGDTEVAMKLLATLLDVGMLQLTDLSWPIFRLLPSNAVAGLLQRRATTGLPASEGADAMIEAKPPSISLEKQAAPR